MFMKSPLLMLHLKWFHYDTLCAYARWKHTAAAVITLMSVNISLYKYSKISDVWLYVTQQSPGDWRILRRQHTTLSVPKHSDVTKCRPPGQLGRRSTDARPSKWSLQRCSDVTTSRPPTSPRHNVYSTRSQRPIRSDHSLAPDRNLVILIIILNGTCKLLE